MTYQLDPLVIVAILGLVNFVKSFGVSGRALTVASMTIGLALSVLAQLLPTEVIQIALIGLLSGLGASGFYDLGALLGTAKKAS